MAFDLSSIQRGKATKPPRVIVYGEHGVGKSTFAAGAPSPIVVQTEDGLSSIDVPHFPLAKSYADVQSALRTLRDEEHDFRTVVVDSLDWLERLIWRHVAQVESKDDIEAFGYGKGYVKAAEVLSGALGELNSLRTERGMVVICTAHTQIRKIEDPLSEAYDRHTIKLHKAAAAVVQEWADVVAYARVKSYVTAEDTGFGRKRTRAIGTGERVLCLDSTPAYEAKNRFGMPHEIPMDWASFAEAARG